jgi:hypothetical protein
MVILNRLPETRSGKNPAKETDALRWRPVQSINNQWQTKTGYDKSCLQNINQLFWQNKHN